MKALPIAILALLACVACSIVAQPPEASELPQATVKILPRSSWAKTDRNGEKLNKHSGKINQIILHHSGAAIHLDGNPKDRINNSIRSWHMEAKGKWGDVAYHYIIDNDGIIYEGRPQEMKGESFTPYDLDRKLLICVLGDYRTLQERLSDLKVELGRDLNQEERTKVESEFKKHGCQLSAKASDSIIALTSLKAKELEIRIDKINTHREIAKSSCPGSNYQKWFNEHGRKQIEKNIRG